MRTGSNPADVNRFRSHTGRVTMAVIKIKRQTPNANLIAYRSADKEQLFFFLTLEGQPDIGNYKVAFLLNK